MNDKIKAILIKLATSLKSFGFTLAPDFEITLKSENKISLKRNEEVNGALGDKEWKDNIEIAMDLTLTSDDQITFYPDYNVYGSIFLQGGSIYDINYKMDASTGFSEADFNNTGKLDIAARQISNDVQNYVQEEYYHYIDENASDIESYKRGGWKADDDASRDR